MSVRLFEVWLKGGAPWGFRLTGGKEFRTSLRVSKVEENGKAEAEGIAVNDEIVAINGRDVLNVYHTEALSFVKRAGTELQLQIRRTGPVISLQESHPNAAEREKSLDSDIQDMIEITAYQPSSTVPKKPVSATSVPQKSVLHYGDPTFAYGDNHEPYGEWSPDVINDVTRVPDQISLENHTESHRNEVDDQDIEERRKKVPHSPTSSKGFQKVTPTGRGSRRLTRNSSSSIDVYDEQPTPETQLDVLTAGGDSECWVYGSNSALRHLQYNKARADEDYYKRTSSLPKSLGRKQKSGANQYHSSTLPRRKPDEKSRQSGAPAWYKEMYREINKSMEGQSNLSRLLSADAKKGAFRRYDGATSPGALSPREGRRQRPKSVHVDRFQYQEIDDNNRFFSKDDMTNQQQTNMGRELEKGQRQHPVHSKWYREFQRGGQIPNTGLSADSHRDTRQINHFRSKSSDDILSIPSKGLPYQTPDHQSSKDKFTDPTRFEYNNPPDFLELRKKAEADGALRDDHERELKMIQEERQKWLREEEEFNSKRQAARKKSEEIKQRQKIEEARRAEEQRQQLLDQRKLENDRDLKVQMQETSGRSSTTFESANSKLKGNALYSFIAQSPMEISFKKGQLLYIIRQIDENWYEGEVDDKIGIFPVNYVQICRDQEAVEEQSEQLPERLEIEEGLARAKYLFRAESEKELSFKKGEKIILLRQLDEHWYEAEISERIGIVPKNYLEVLKEPRILNNDHQIFEETLKEDLKLSSKDHQKDNEAVDNVGVPVLQAEEEKHFSTKGERYRSIFSYRPMNADEVELLENDIILVLEKCDDGWFVGVCERTGKFGTFPGNYVVPC